MWNFFKIKKAPDYAPDLSPEEIEWAHQHGLFRESFGKKYWRCNMRTPKGRPWITYFLETFTRDDFNTMKKMKADIDRVHNQ